MGSAYGGNTSFGARMTLSLDKVRRCVRLFEVCFEVSSFRFSVIHLTSIYILYLSNVHIYSMWISFYVFRGTFYVG